MRDSLFDSLRGIAMVGIVLIHVHSYFLFFHSAFEPTQVFTLLLANLSRFSVPVFIFSAGYFLTKKGLWEYWKPKILSILVPYALVSLLGYYIKYNEYSLADFLYRLVMGKVFTPFYFIPLLFQFYVIYFLFFRTSYSSLVLTILLHIALVINIASNQGWFRFLPVDYFVISPTNFVFFFMLGIYIRSVFQNLNSINNDKVLRTFLRIFLILQIFFIVYKTITDMQAISNHTILYPTLFILSYTGFQFNARFLSITKEIGLNSMGIFLLHPILIHFMHSIDPYLLGGRWIAVIVVAFLNIALPLGAWKILKRAIPSL